MVEGFRFDQLKMYVSQHQNDYYYKTTDYFANSFGAIGTQFTNEFGATPSNNGQVDEDDEFGLNYIQPSNFTLEEPHGTSSISEVYDKIHCITGNGERKSAIDSQENQHQTSNGMQTMTGMTAEINGCNYGNNSVDPTHGRYTSTDISGEEPVAGSSNGGYSYEDEESDYDDDIVISSRQDISMRRESTRSNHSNSIELSATTEMLRIRFPYQSISIRVADFFSLREKNFINDTIVDFYLNHIVEHVLPDDDDKRVTVLPAIFWHNLSLLQNGPEAEEKQQMSKRQMLDARFGDVFEFVKDFEMMNVDYIVIPVSEWDHWSVVIVCSPYSADGRIVCFDSQIRDDLNNINNTAQLINQFLKYVWLRRNGREYPLELATVIPTALPQQAHAYDCGVYIGEFTKRFLLKPPNNLDKFDFSAEYADFTIDERRRQMQKAIISLYANKRIGAYLLQFLEYAA